MSEQQKPFPSSPNWVRNTKLFVAGWVLIFAVALAFYFNQLFLYFIIAIVVSYVIRPIVDFIDEQTKLPRFIPTAIVYLILLGALIAIPISTIPSIVRNVSEFISNLPTLFEQVVETLTTRLREPLFSFRGESYYIPVETIQIEEYEQYLGDFVSLLGSSLGSVSDIASGFLGASVEVVSWVAFILFVSFYLTKDGHQIPKAVINSAPDAYAEDAHQLMHRLDRIWGAFLRGQVFLMFTIGIVVTLMAYALGLPNPIALGVIAGLMEIVPYAGPVLSAVPGGLLAFFQPDASWIGASLGAPWFTVIVLFCYWLVQQLENYILLPRIMGHQLKLHPVVVFAGAIAGWQVAGILGIFLASPVVATIRLGWRYVYCKLTDQSLMRYFPIEEAQLAEDGVIPSAETDSPPQIDPDPVPSAIPQPVMANLEEKIEQAQPVQRV